MPEIQLTQGTIHYRDQGTGPVVVLIHGLLVNSSVWDRLISSLGPDVRVIAPELPLGSHRTPMRPGADLTPPGLARLIAELLERLELEQVTLVGNDTGGALCQLVAAKHPERIGGLVLTNCDAFEHFPPPAFKLLVKVLARVPGAAGMLGFLGRSRRARERSMKLVPLTVNPVPDELLADWIAPLRERGVRHDMVQVLRGISPHQTIAAAQQLRAFERPALIVWGKRDRFFPFADAERLAAALPNARIEQVPNARTFVQLDAPQRLAELVIEMASAPDSAVAHRT